MFCTNCGNQVADGSAFCPYCGTSFAQTQQQPQQQPQAPVTPVVQAPQQGSYTAPEQVAYPGQSYGQQPTYQPYGGQPQYGTPGYDPNNPYGYAAPPQQGVSEAEIKSTRTLGIVALVVGFFIPLVGYICGGIGLSKVRKLSFFADPMQKQQLDKNKVLCILGIVIPAVMNVIASIAYIASNS